MTGTKKWKACCRLSMYDFNFWKLVNSLVKFFTRRPAEFKTHTVLCTDHNTKSTQTVSWQHKAFLWVKERVIKGMIQKINPTFRNFDIPAKAWEKLLEPRWSRVWTNTEICSGLYAGSVSSFSRRGLGSSLSTCSTSATIPFARTTCSRRWAHSAPGRSPVERLMHVSTLANWGHNG